MISNTVSHMEESVTIPLPVDQAGRITSGILSIALGIAWVFSAKSLYTGGWFFVMYGTFHLLWGSAANYAITVSGTMLRITTTVLGFRWWTRNYPVREISSLRVAQQLIFHSSRPMLMFERKGKTKIFGETSRLKLKPNSEKLLDPVYGRFPSLRPTPQDPKYSSPQVATL